MSSKTESMSHILCIFMKVFEFIVVWGKLPRQDNNRQQPDDSGMVFAQALAHGVITNVAF
jgi:hypothetical protein